MKKAVNFLFVGWVLGTFIINQATLAIFTTQAVEAAPALAFVSGTVKDEGGAPLIGAVIGLLEAHPRGKEIKSFKTDAQGRFNTAVAPGSYRLRAMADGFLPAIQRINVDRPVNVTHNFQLKRTDTLVQKRGDRDDYRWIGRSVPRHVLNLFEDETAADDATGQTKVEVARNSFARRPPIHGMAQFLAVGSSARAGLPGASFFGTNFAVAGTLGNVEMAVIGQRGAGALAPQRLSAIATLSPTSGHQVTASIGYGQMALARRLQSDFDPTVEAPVRMARPLSAGAPRSLDQVSISAIDEWQVFQPLLVIYGLDYSRFISSAASQQESVLPRVALQYTPSARWRVNAAYTPRASQTGDSLESFNTENINAQFETQAPETALLEAPLLDRSRRIELGIERLFNNGSASLEASAFYDVISGHGVGVLALPLEASPENQATFQQVAHQVAAMNGAARGARLMYGKRLNDYVSASAGYSFGYGSRFNNVPLGSLTPGRMFSNGFFQVAAAKLELDFSQQTGTRVSTVIRLSPAAVVFAIDPFAGRMSVYDPNINIYVTQDLPSFGLPLRWQALVDMRNLLDQAQGVEAGDTQLIATRSRRTVRGGIAFRW